MEQSLDTSKDIHMINEVAEEFANTPLLITEEDQAQKSPSPNKKKKSTHTTNSSDSDDEKKDPGAKWAKRDNEIDELKKIFFEFLMRWSKQNEVSSQPYKPRVYKKDTEHDDRLTLDKLFAEEATSNADTLTPVV